MFGAGMPLPLTVDAFASESFQGRVLSVAPAADPKARSFEIAVSIENSTLKLRAGMIASTHITAETTNRHQVRIPIDALVHDPIRDQYVVYTLDRNSGGLTSVKAVHVRPGPTRRQPGLDSRRPHRRRTDSRVGAIFANIRKFLRYLLSSNIGEVMTMFFGVELARQIGLDVGGGAVVLPLLATQILWINLVTDGPPALALGLDPADEGLMSQPPRPSSEGVITPRMWRGIVLVGIIMAVGTLFVLDASMPGGFVSGSGDLRYGQTMALRR
jgi:hypothetical protein